MPERVPVTIDGRELSLSNLEKVLYPETGFTKGEVIDYYRRIAPTMLPHLRDRAVTLRRYPNGVDGQSFFEKRCPKHRPDWVRVELGPGDRKGGIYYCVFDDVASLVWAANLAALELHSPMARATDLEQPDMIVFDLDPGRPAAMPECAQIGLRIAEVLEKVDLEAFAKTSGSKGLQIYLPIHGPLTHEEASDFALAVGQVVAKTDPGLVVTNMAKAERKGKVFVDWSQNSRHKTTIAPYSLRARPSPTVSTPVTWDEVRTAADGSVLSFTADEMPARVEEHGDLFAGTLELHQKIPTARS